MNINNKPINSKSNNRIKNVILIMNNIIFKILISLKAQH